MKRLPVRRILVVFLTVFLTAGMNVSVVQASDMTAKMAMAVDMGASGSGSCDASDTGGGAGMKGAACTSICVAPVLAALLPQAAPVTVFHQPVSFAARYPLLHGRTSPPDPYPPRPTDIG